MKRVAIYCRISDDREGHGEGVARQREECLARVAAEGWELVSDGLADTFTDNDVSAFKSRARPAYRRMLAEVRAGRVDVVMAWHSDRLYRRGSDLEEFITVVERAGVKVSTLKAGEIDLSTATGRMTARIVGNVSQHESEQKVERIRSAMTQKAGAGHWHGSRRVFGYAESAPGSRVQVIVESEAAVIRDAAERVLSGEPLQPIVDRLIVANVPTIRGGRWNRTTLRAILIAARNAGWREHQSGRTNQQLGGPYPGGEFVAEGDWPAILTRTQVERLRRVLSDPDKKRGPSRRTYLLGGGLLRCGACASSMVGRPSRKAQWRGVSQDDAREYMCGSPKVSKAERDAGVAPLACTHRSIAAPLAEAFVVDVVRERVNEGLLDELRERARSSSSGVDDAWALVQALDVEQAELAQDYAHRRITRAIWLTVRDPLAEQADAARRRAQALSVDTMALALPSTSRRWNAQWDASDVAERRKMLTWVLDRVDLGPAHRGSPPVDRLDLRWRGAAAAV